MTRKVEFLGDVLQVTDSGGTDEFGNATATVYSIQPHQVAAHRSMFDADMTAAQKTKATQLATRLAAK